MSGKLFAGRTDTTTSLMRGLDLVADSVAPTLGPLGRTVVIQRPDAGPLVTSDGRRVAEAVEVMRAPFMNQGVQLGREIGRTTHTSVGDGTTTAIVVARSLAREALRLSAAGVNPVLLRRGIETAMQAAVAWIRREARPVAGRDELARVAGASARDRRIGELVASALERVGSDGVIDVKDASAYGVRLEFRHGMSFDNGFITPALATDPIRRETVFSDPYVLVARERLTQVGQLAQVLAAAAAERAPLVVIADEVSGDALTLLVLNVEKRRIPVVAVKAPMFGDDRESTLCDIAVLTGGRVYGPGFGVSSRRAELEGLGRAARVVVTADRTTLVDGHGSRSAIAERRRGIEAEITSLESEYEREKRRQRLARLDGTVAAIHVGLDTATEQEETRNRIRGAIQAGRAALRGGVVPGGGTTLVRAAGALGVQEANAAAQSVVRNALEGPLRQLASNAGIDPGFAVDRVRAAPDGHGLDVELDRIVDLMGAGIFDAVDTLCVGLEIAASMAGTCLLADGIIADRPLPRPHRRPHGHHHGVDHGHFGPPANPALHPHPHGHAPEHNGATHPSVGTAG